MNERVSTTVWILGNSSPQCDDDDDEDDNGVKRGIILPNVAEGKKNVGIIIAVGK